MLALFVQQILPVVVATILVPLLSYAGLQLAAYLKSKVKNQTVQTILLKITDAAFTAAAETLQTSVDAAKAASADGKLPADIAKAARDAGLASMLSHVSLEEIMAAFGCSEEAAKRVAEARLEAAVLQLKREKAHRINPVTATP